MPARIDPVNAITLLGFIEEKPRSGYALKQDIEERLEHILEITPGTLYYTLKRLEAKGWVKARPGQPRIYRITRAGREAFTALLEEAMAQPQRPITPFDLALYFTPQLPAEAVTRAIDKHLEDQDRVRRALHTLEERFPVRWPFHLYYLREKTKDIADTNARWWSRLKKKIEAKSGERKTAWSTSR